MLPLSGKTLREIARLCGLLGTAPWLRTWINLSRRCVASMPNVNTSFIQYASLPRYLIVLMFPQLDTVLYQLHTLSFFLSPSLWSYLCRIVSQSQITKPRELDSSRSLRFFFCLVVVFNASSIWSHIKQGAVGGRATILDFVGVGGS